MADSIHLCKSIDLYDSAEKSTPLTQTSSETSDEQVYMPILDSFHQLSTFYQSLPAHAEHSAMEYYPSMVNDDFNLSESPINLSMMKLHH